MAVPRPREGSAAGRIFLVPPYYSQRAVFASLCALFHFYRVFTFDSFRHCKCNVYKCIAGHIVSVFSTAADSASLSLDILLTTRLSTYCAVNLTTTVCDSFPSPVKLSSVGLRAGRSACVIESNGSLDVTSCIETTWISVSSSSDRFLVPVPDDLLVFLYLDFRFLLTPVISTCHGNGIPAL